MVIVLAVVTLGGLAWLLGRRRGAGAPRQSGPVQSSKMQSSTVQSASLAAPFEGRSIPAAQLQEGRIVLTRLAKHYPDVKAVENLSVVVQPGRVTGFLGPNGAGKTTTLRMLLGLITPTTGTATIGGVRYADLDQPIRRVGSILEASAAHKGRTGRNHLRIICQSAGIPLERADEVLAIAGLSAAGRRKFKEYSLGMRQRLGIAAALIGDPQVLILDEPTNGLDPEGIRWMRDLLRGLAAAGRTILVSSHLLAEVEQLADDLVIIAGGSLVAHGTMASVIGSMIHSCRTLVRTPDVEKLAAALDSSAFITPGDPGDVYVTGADAVAIGDAAQRAGIAIHQLTTERPDLEAAFLQLTSGNSGIR